MASDFWKELSARKRFEVGKCERCGSVDKLQSHHKLYRGDWYSTQIEDLEVLCRGCHREEHGLPRGREWLMVFRGDIRFSRFMHWIGYLNMRMGRYGPVGLLKDRERRYLDRALAAYPPEPKDSCMEFHVRNCLEMNERAKEF